MTSITARSSVQSFYSHVETGSAVTTAFCPQFLLVIDFISTLCLAEGAAWLYHEMYLQTPWSAGPATLVGAFVSLVFTTLQQLGGAYSGPRRLTDDLAKLVLRWGMTFLIITSAIMLLKISDQVSRGVLLVFFTAGVIVLCLLRIGWFYVAAHSRHGATILKPRILLIRDPASDDEVSRTAEHLCKITKTVPLPDPGEYDGDQLLHEVGRACLQEQAEEIYISAPLSRADSVAALVRHLSRLPIPIKYVPSDHSMLLERTPSHIGDLLAFQVRPAPLSRLDRAIKRAVDVVLATILLLLLSPVFLIVAVLIKWDSSGPVFFRQRRNGLNSAPFRIWKFRTMSVLEDGDAITQATRNDARVTRVGAVLRKSSLDEIPQILNVIRGEMSIVGPRPHACAHDDHYGALISEYMYRQHIKPGITGWAQVHGLRGETIHVDQMRMRIEYDYWYIQNWSIALDLRILFQTLWTVFRSEAF